MCAYAHGEMIDLGVGIPGIGQMYVCVTFCAPKLVALMGGHSIESGAPCTATKRNGEPCSAKALPGYDLCVSHLSKQQKEEKKDADLLAV